MLLLESPLDAIFQLFNHTSEGIFISKLRHVQLNTRGIQRRSPKYIGNFVRLSQDMNSTQ